MLFKAAALLAAFLSTGVAGLALDAVSMGKSLASRPHMLRGVSATERANSGDVEGYGIPPDEIARSLGYPGEVHSVTTDDGYILNLYRVPHGKGNAGKSTKPAVLIMHGITVNAASWFLLEEDSLPFVLAEDGYDVWVGCSRGTIYGKGHKTLSSDSDDFWDFSWHENGVYDVPAFVSYIVARTGQEKIQYVGHSMGTTMFCVWCSLMESCRERIHSAYLLSPVVYMNHLKGMYEGMAPVAQTPLIEKILVFLSDHLSHGAINLSRPALRKVLVPMCTALLTSHMCREVLQVLSGPEQDGELQTDIFHRSIKYFPDNFSIKQLANYGQELQKAKTFQRYDNLDSKKNLEQYGSTTPPKYPLQNMSIPISLYYGGNDYLADPQDVEDLSKDIPKLQRLVSFDSYTHMDFLTGKTVRSRLYDKLVDNMKDDFGL